MIGAKRLLLMCRPFSPSRLYSAGQPGIWYGTSLTDGKQDATGVTALTGGAL